MGFEGKKIFGAQINRSVKEGMKIADVFTKYALFGAIWGISKLWRKEKTSNYAKHYEIIRKANLAEIANKSENKRLFYEFINTEIVNDYSHFINKIKIRLLDTLTLYYKNPTSSNLFDSLRLILEEKKESARQNYVKKECTICIEVLNLLEQYKDINKVILQITSKPIEKHIVNEKIISITSQSDEQQLLNEFSKSIEKNSANPNCLILDTSATRIYTALVTFYKEPKSSNLFYELKCILQDKISSVKTEKIKNECRVAIEILNLLEKYRNADKVIADIEDKYSN